MMQKTLVLFKPDAVKRAIVGEILQRFEKIGLKIVAMKMVWKDKKFSQEHYKEHLKKPFYKQLENYITSGPVIAICLEGINAVNIVRKMVGSTAPEKAMPGTIRGDYAHMSKEWADRRNIGVINLIHASDSENTAKKELKLWFKKNEMHSYKTIHEDLVF